MKKLVSLLMLSFSTINFGAENVVVKADNELTFAEWFQQKTEEVLWGGETAKIVTEVYNDLEDVEHCTLS